MSSQTPHQTKPFISEKRLIDPTVNEVDIVDNIDYIFPQLKVDSERKNAFIKAVAA
jgi:hypothetical protein